MYASQTCTSYSCGASSPSRKWRIADPDLHSRRVDQSAFDSHSPAHNMRFNLPFCLWQCNRLTPAVPPDSRSPSRALYTWPDVKSSGAGGHRKLIYSKCCSVSDIATARMRAGPDSKVAVEVTPGGGGGRRR